MSYVVALYMSMVLCVASATDVDILGVHVAHMLASIQLIQV